MEGAVGPQSRIHVPSISTMTSALLPAKTTRMTEITLKSCPQIPCRILDLGIVNYAQGLAIQREMVENHKGNDVSDSLLLVEHPHVITLGRSGKLAHLLASAETLRQQGVDYYETDRGGDITYHGPGQLVAYPIMDLKCWHRDIHLFMRTLEECVIQLLAGYGIQSQRIPGATGVWVGHEKIAALGVRTSQWITSHGLALNVNTDLSFFSFIIPCGLAKRGVTSLAKLLGRDLAMAEVKERFCDHFGRIFERTMHLDEENNVFTSQ
jgi:lipoyl(octanoyl) transferase